MDKEKVIKGLEICKNHDGSNCLECPYFVDECVDDLCADVLAMLKEQQEQIDRLIEENASNAEMAEGLKELLKEQDDEIKELRSIVEFWKEKALHT